VTAERTWREVVLGSWRGRAGVGVIGLFVFLAIFGNLIAPHDPDASSLDILARPSTDHWLGTTEQGSDVFSQLLVGARVSIVVGFAAAAISAVLGALVGLVGGYFGGWTDRILDSFENWFLVIPQIPLMIVLARLLEPSLTVLIAVIGLTSWAGTGRIVRAQVLTLRERAFVERAHFVGPHATCVHHRSRPHVDDAAVGVDLHAGHASRRALQHRDRECVVHCDRAVLDGSARDREGESRVVGLCVVVEVRGRERIGPQRGHTCERVVARHAAMRLLDA